jgi:hypothetical protein
MSNAHTREAALPIETHEAPHVPQRSQRHAHTHHTHTRARAHKRTNGARRCAETRKGMHTHARKHSHTDTDKDYSAHQSRGQTGALGLVVSTPAVLASIHPASCRGDAPAVPRQYPYSTPAVPLQYPCEYPCEYRCSTPAVPPQYPASAPAVLSSEQPLIVSRAQKVSRL